jgi:4-hydroxysphinganine ceramide fatty acyl 2-hydroxylase
MQKLKGNAQFEDKEFHKELFRNKILDNLTRTSVKIPVTLFTLISVAVSYYSFYIEAVALGKFILLFGLGFLFFTLLEYMIHRFLYHPHDGTPPKEGSWQYLFHGVHHDFPKDRERLAMPPIVALAIAAVFFILFYLILSQYSLAFFSGFTFAYAIYLCLHYAIHSYSPPKNFLKYLWKHHSLHHYKHHDKAFGVTSALWDIVFRTMPKEEKKA